MTDKKPIIIDLCKIGYGLWMIVTILLALGVVDSYVSLPYYEEDNTHEVCPHYDLGDAYCNAKNELVIESWCSKGLFDKDAYCTSGNSKDYFYIGHFDFGILWIPLLVLNSVNGVALFIILNRKYGKYEFKLKRCNGEYL